MASSDQQHTYSICLTNLPIGTEKEALLAQLSGLSVKPISCAFTLSHDNRAVAELWFGGEQVCSDSADIIEKSRKVIVIND